MGTQTDTIKLALAGTQDFGVNFLHCWVANTLWLERAA